MTSLYIEAIVVNFDIPPNHSIRLKLVVDGQKISKSERIKAGRPWKPDRPINIRRNTSIVIRINKVPLLGKSKPLSEIDFQGEAALERYLGALGIPKLAIPNSGPGPRFMVEITFPHKSAVGPAILQAAEELKKRQSILDRLGKIRPVVETVLSIGGAVVELNPIAKAAGTAIQKVYDYLKDQEDFDTLICELAEKIVGVGELSERTKRYARIEELNKVIDRVGELMNETEIFISEYKRAGVAVRALKSTVSTTARERFDNLDKKFKAFMDEFDQAVIAQILENGNASYEQDWLDKLNHVADARSGDGRTCLGTTRSALLSKIMGALGHPDTSTPQAAPNPIIAVPFVWVRGVTGSGKSSIAGSIAGKLDNHLGASFFCERSKSGIGDLDDPGRVIPTLAWQLALSHEPFKKELVAVLRKNPNVGNIPQQFENLLKGPLLKISEPPQGGPLVILIDALDECGDAKTRKPLISSLKAASGLVPWLRVMITSRPTADIHDFFGDTVKCFDLDKIDASDDILAFAQERMQEINVDDKFARQLVERAHNLFAWAEMALDYIEEGVDRIGRMEGVLSDRIDDIMREKLAIRYNTALKASLNRGNDNDRIFRTIIGTIVALCYPLPIRAIGALLFQRISSQDVLKSQIDQVRSILYEDQNGIIRLCHPSFASFVSGKNCPEDLRVYLDRRHVKLASMCLEAIMARLRPNLSQLPLNGTQEAKLPVGPSYRFNQDLSGLDASTISAELQYSCIHWLDHLLDRDLGLHGEVTSTLERFFVSGYVLCWIEVLSHANKLEAIQEERRRRFVVDHLKNGTGSYHHIAIGMLSNLIVT